MATAAPIVLKAHTKAASVIASKRVGDRFRIVTGSADPDPLLRRRPIKFSYCRTLPVTDRRPTRTGLLFQPPDTSASGRSCKRGHSKAGHMCCVRIAAVRQVAL